MIVTARRAMKSTTMAMARRDTATTPMTMYVNVDDDNTSSTTSDEGDNGRERQLQSR